MDAQEEKRRLQEYDEAFKILQSELRKEKDVKLSHDAKEDFPELFEEEVEFDDETNKYIKKSMIEEVIENVEVKKEGVYDKRLKQSLFKRILDALFG